MDAGTAKVGDGIAYADGPRHKLDIYAPEQRGAPAPVVFFIYGGGWNRGERSDYQFVGRALAARGFVTVIADYRLVPEVQYRASSKTAPMRCAGCRTISPAMAATRTGCSSPAIRRGPIMR